MEISVKHNIQQTIQLLDRRVRKQVAFATSKALNVIAKTAQQGVITEMKQRFDRPTPFTLNSTFIKYSTKNNLVARIYVKDRELAKSKSLAESIGHEFSGGYRIRTRLEAWLTRAGYISASEFVVPGAGAKLDAYGNLSRGQIQQILSQLMAGPDASSYRSGSSRSKAKRAAAGYFWSRGGKLKRGVYQRFSFASGGAVKPVLIVVSRPKYKKRIDMDAIGQRVIRKDFDTEFKKQLQFAMETAR